MKIVDLELYECDHRDMRKAQAKIKYTHHGRDAHIEISCHISISDNPQLSEIQSRIIESLGVIGLHLKEE